MRKVLAVSGMVVAGLLGACLLSGGERVEAAAADTMIAHNVYFALKDNSPAAKQKLVDACKKHLAKHDGVVYFATGILAADLDRPVNDRDFDVGLHMVFKDRAAHDKYQDHPRHKQFIDENKDNWKKVRVFDSVVGQ